MHPQASPALLVVSPRLVSPVLQAASSLLDSLVPLAANPRLASTLLDDNHDNTPAEQPSLALSTPGHGSFSWLSFRGLMQLVVLREPYKLINSYNVISAHESAAHKRVDITTQLSEGGKQTGRNEESRGVSKAFQKLRNSGSIQQPFVP